MLFRKIRKRYIGPLLPKLQSRPIFNKGRLEDGPESAYDVQLTSNFHQISQRVGGFQYG